MGHDDRREILERLEALERMAHSRRDERGGQDHDRHGRHGGRGGHRDHGRERHRDGHDGCHHDHSGSNDAFDEKRVIDTIVHLVSERVAHMLDERQPYTRDDEKRLIDLIVGLVSEHVGAIVRSELDRRLGPGDKDAGDAPPDESGSEEHER
jgi:hypothetical protein